VVASTRAVWIVRNTAMVRIADGTEARDIDTAFALRALTAPSSDVASQRPAAAHQTIELAASPGGFSALSPSSELTRGHYLSPFIARHEVLQAADLGLILEQVHLGIRIYGTGTIPASTNPASHYATHAWTRDSAVCALALLRAGRSVEGVDALAHLAAFYNHPDERNKFLRFHYDSEASALYRSPDSSHHPHIKGAIDGVTRRMVRYEHPWSHNQLDAIGMWLFATFRAANDGILDLGALDRELTRSVNSDNIHDSIVCVALKFLARVRYHDQHDTGPWEDCNLPRRATSIGSCLAAFREAHRFFERVGYTEWHKGYPAGRGSLRSEIEDAIAAGTAAVAARIHPNGEFAIENDRFLSDSSLSFLLHPFNPGLNRAQEDAIVRALYRDRSGEVGFSRRDDDDYLGMNYIRYPGVMSDLKQPDYRPAEWTLFDPLLAAFFYERYAASQGVDAVSLRLADRHLKRALSQITSDVDVFCKCDGTIVTVPARVVPEAYWFDSLQKRWRPNENTPLPMSAAAYTFMFESARRALGLPHAAELGGRKE
jgi:hypothetical protein